MTSALIDTFIVDAIRDLRNNPGTGEYKLIAEFNEYLVENPVPVE